jgi:RND family efflux transporter MFP subunit
MKKILTSFIFLPLIIVVAIIIVVIQLKSKQALDHHDDQFPIKTVEVLSLKKIPFRTRAVAYGNVEPATILKAKSEVNGKISYIHPELKQGGSLPKGTTVLRIETTTFEISLDSSKAGLASSQSSLAQIEAEEKSAIRSVEIARKNLDLGRAELNRVKVLVEKSLIAQNQVNIEEQKVLQLTSTVQDLQGKVDAYASRKASIRAQIKQSKSQVDQSQDSLVRTEIILPFDARIGSVSVDEGEFVAAGSQLFEALGTEAVEINAQLPINHVRPLASNMNNTSKSSDSLNLNLVNSQGDASFQTMIKRWNLDANVRMVGGDQDIVWQGVLLRISESVDPTRDTLGMVVAVDKPYEGVIPGIRPPLLKGMYVSVEFLSSPTNRLVIPRKAMHENRVYVVSDENTLSIRPIQVDYMQGQLVVVKSGLEEGDKIITSDLIPVIEGIRLELIESDEFQKEIEALALGEHQ